MLPEVANLLVEGLKPFLTKVSIVTTSTPCWREARFEGWYAGGAALPPARFFVDDEGARPLVREGKHNK